MAVNFHKKQTELHQNFIGSYKKAQGCWMNFKIHRISKSKKVNKLWQKQRKRSIQ